MQWNWNTDTDNNVFFSNQVAYKPEILVHFRFVGCLVVPKM